MVKIERAQLLLDVIRTSICVDQKPDSFNVTYRHENLLNEQEMKIAKTELLNILGING